MSTRFIDHLLVGVIADRPAATAVPAGTLYSSTDKGMVYQSDGTNWDDCATLGATETLPGTLIDAKGDLIAASAAGAPGPAPGRHQRADPHRRLDANARRQMGGSAKRRNPRHADRRQRRPDRRLRRRHGRPAQPSAATARY